MDSRWRHMFPLNTASSRLDDSFSSYFLVIDVKLGSSCPFFSVSGLSFSAFPATLDTLPPWMPAQQLHLHV